MDVGRSSDSYGQPTMVSAEVGGVNDGGFLESWISDISPRNKEPPVSYSFGSSSTSTARMLQVNAQLVYNEVNTTVVNKTSDSLMPSFGANYVVNDANLLLPNTALLQIPSIHDTQQQRDLEFPSTTMSFATNSLVNTVMDGYRQGGKRQQSAAAKSGFDVYQLSQQRGIRIETVTQLSKKPRQDTSKDVLQPQINQHLHFEKSLVQLQEKNSELTALLEQQRQQNQLHKQISLLGVEAQGVQAEQAGQHEWQQLQNQGQVSSLPCFDGNICIRRLMQYLYHKRSRPINNEIHYWRKFISEYYAPCAKQRWCLSICENINQQALSLFTETATESWCCSICGSKSSKGFEVIYETLPRLFKTKFEGGMLDEILFLGLPQEHRFPSGLIMLEYGKAVQETVYEKFRIVHEGILRVTFRHDLKIFSWEFCAQRHEELLQHQSVARQIDHFVEAAQKYRITINNFDRASTKDIQSCCNMFLTAERELARNVELPLVNDLGFSKKHFRCLQIAEVVGSMTDLITISHELGVGPIESLKNYRRLKQVNEQRTTHSVVTRDEGLAGDDGYSQLFRQDARGSVARTQMLQPYSTANSSQIEFTNERMKSIEHAVDKLLFAKETACRVNSLGALRASEASGTATSSAALPQISDTIMLANAINFGENAAALAIAQANLMANAQLSAEMCKAAFNSSSSTVNMSVKVEPWFQEQV